VEVKEMDHESFDRLARLLSVGGSRRTALGAFAAAGLLGSAGLAEGKSRRSKRRKGQRVGSAAADCFSPGPGTNLSRCDYTRASLRNADLSGSVMVGTKFNQADLCGADLSSSQLRNAQFKGAFLFRTDLSSSGCRGVQFDADTVFCLTKTCNGAIRNDDCPGRDVSGLCCGDDDCAPGTICCQGRIRAEAVEPEPPRFAVGQCRTSCDFDPF
jgi:hypothetical protein